MCILTYLQEKKTTLFVWPEGVFSGYSYEEILTFKELFKKVSLTSKCLILKGKWHGVERPLPVFFLRLDY